MTYSEKLKDPRWQKKRLEIFQRDSFKCTLCGDDKTTLHVHHLDYDGDPWDIDNQYLITHCQHCHIIVELVKTVLSDEGVSVYLVYKIPKDEKVVQIFSILANNKKTCVFIGDISSKGLITDQQFLTVPDLKIIENMITVVQEKDDYKKLFKDS